MKLGELHETNPHRWIEASYGGPWEMAYAVGYHNGPECEACGFFFCMHCDPGLSATECGAVAPVQGSATKLGAMAAYSEALRSSLGLAPEGYDG